MRSSRILVAVLMLGATSCVARQTVLDRALTGGAQWLAILEPAAGETLQGRFVIVRTDATAPTRAVISLAGAAPGRALPWHVHYGRCGADGGIVGRPSDYPPLIVGQTGTLEAVALIPTTLEPATSYYVNVHESPMEGREIACGALRLDSGLRVAGASAPR